jgi:hypothetical protein
MSHARSQHPKARLAPRHRQNMVGHPPTGATPSGMNRNNTSFAHSTPTNR